MLGSIINLLGGSVFGLAGSLLSKWLDQKAEAQKFANEVALKRVDAEIMQQEWAARTRVAEVEGAAAVEVEDAKAFGAAVQSEDVRYSEGLGASRGQAWLMFVLDFVRGMVRPGLTVYLAVITTLVYLQARALVSNMDPMAAAAQVAEIQGKILFLTEAVVMYWFGMRAGKK